MHYWDIGDIIGNEIITDYTLLSVTYIVLIIIYSLQASIASTCSVYNVIYMCKMVGLSAQCKHILTY